MRLQAWPCLSPVSLNKICSIDGHLLERVDCYQNRTCPSLHNQLECWLAYLQAQSERQISRCKKLLATIWNARTEETSIIGPLVDSPWRKQIFAGWWIFFCNGCTRITPNNFGCRNKWGIGSHINLVLCISMGQIMKNRRLIEVAELDKVIHSLQYIRICWLKHSRTCCNKLQTKVLSDRDLLRHSHLQDILCETQFKSMPLLDHQKYEWQPVCLLQRGQPQKSRCFPLISTIHEDSAQ